MHLLRALPLSLLLACSSEPARVKTPPGPKVPLPAQEVKQDDFPAKPVPDATEACAGIVVISWTGAEGADTSVTRDEAAAKDFAEAVREKLLGGVELPSLAASSDEPKTKAKGGAMGTYEREKWPEKYAALAEPVFAINVGEVTPVVRFPHGFVVARRCAVEKVTTKHILIRYKGAKNAEADIKRDAVAARELAEKVYEEASKPGADFAALAKKYSEDGSAERGGELGSVGRGMFAPAFETTAFALKPGQTSEVVETDFGFHVIQRVE